MLIQIQGIAPLLSLK